MKKLIVVLSLALAYPIAAHADDKKLKTKADAPKVMSREDRLDLQNTMYQLKEIFLYRATLVRKYGIDPQEFEAGRVSVDFGSGAIHLPPPPAQKAAP